MKKRFFGCICGDGMCPYVPCSKYPKCNHEEKLFESWKKDKEKEGVK
jgi:hypothetical protein